MKTSWLVLVTGEHVEVSGFRRSESARDHANKHFLNPLELWRMLCVGEPTPEDLMDQLITANSAIVTRELFDLAAGRYVGIVRDHSATPFRAEKYYQQPRSAPAFWALGVVTESGIFASFAADGLSDLRTAFRPDFVGWHQPVTNRDYRNAASNRLDHKLAKSELAGED
jgi:hypothetical protein